MKKLLSGLTGQAAGATLDSGPNWSEIEPMLKLTKKADYGLISLKHLTVNRHKGSASAKELADTYGIPVPMLAKVLQKLVRDGFLESEQGTNGGYRLARDPSTITALEVIRSIDGPVILTTCFTSHSDCGLSPQCTVREPLRRVHEGILKLLDNISMTDLSADEDPPGAGHKARQSGIALTVLAPLGAH